MILVAVIVGYILGAMPFVLPKIIESREKQIEVKENEAEYKLQEEIQDEWLNGPKKENSNGINQADIYNEYVTGEVTTKGV